MINGPFRVDGKQVQCAFSVLIFSHTTTFSRDSNLGHKNNSFAWGTAGGLRSSVALEDSMHFRKCCHGGAMGSCGVWQSWDLWKVQR